jgi:hypothetical protein
VNSPAHRYLTNSLGKLTTRLFGKLTQIGEYTAYPREIDLTPNMEERLACLLTIGIPYTTWRILTISMNHRFRLELIPLKYSGESVAARVMLVTELWSS